MSTADDERTQAELEELHRKIAELQDTLSAISSGGVDAVVLGEAETERVYSLETADRSYRVIVESMGEGAATVSASGVILFVNPQLARFLGVERESMVGRDIADYVGDSHADALASLLVESSTETRRAELMVSDADGTDVPFLVAATDIDLEGVLVRCLVLTDLTAQKLLEHHLVDVVAQDERLRFAAEVNDTIVQGLVATEMALDLGQVEYARELVANTSNHARNWIGELAGGQELDPGTAVRSAPAQRRGDT